MGQELSPGGSSEAGIRSAMDFLHQEITRREKLMDMTKRAINRYLPAFRQDEGDYPIPQKIREQVSRAAGEYLWMRASAKLYSGQYEFLFLKKDKTLIQMRPYLQSKGSHLRFYSSHSWNGFLEKEINEMLTTNDDEKKLEAFHFIKETANPEWKLEIREKTLSKYVFKKVDAALTQLEQKGKAPSGTPLAIEDMKYFIDQIKEGCMSDEITLISYGKDSELFGTALPEFLEGDNDSFVDYTESLFGTIRSYITQEDEGEARKEYSDLKIEAENIIKQINRNKEPANPLFDSSGNPIDLEKWFEEWLHTLY